MIVLVHTMLSCWHCMAAYMCACTYNHTKRHTLSSFSPLVLGTDQGEGDLGSVLALLSFPVTPRSLLSSDRVLPRCPLPSDQLPLEHSLPSDKNFPPQAPRSKIKGQSQLCGRGPAEPGEVPLCSGTCLPQLRTFTAGPQGAGSGT